MSSVIPQDFAHLKIPLESILTATNNFSNLVGTTGANYYTGRLLWSGELISILAERLNKESFDGDQQFWTEVSLLSSLKHKNLVSFVGFCDENDEKVIIYKYETRLSLYQYLSDPMRLTWVRRLEISIGVAQALSYIHYDEARDFSVIHRNINSGSVYVNDKWEPKLGDFMGSMKLKASERHQPLNTHKVWISKDGYTDPTYIETKSINHKSDMYSFGIVLFELLCGRRAVIEDEQDNKYLAPMAITHYREKRLQDIIDRDLWKQMDSESFNIFAETAYDCLNEERSQRPNIDEIVPKLEKALKLALKNRPEGPQDRGCGYFMWMDDFMLRLSSSRSSTPQSSYQPGPSTRPNYSHGSSRSSMNLRNPECSNCKFLAEKIKTLEAKINILEGALEMARHPEHHTDDSAAILHEIYNNMGNLGLE